VDVRKPPRVLGTNTVNSLQSGLYYGYLGLIDGILERLIAELGENVNIVATGGLAPLMGGGSKYIREIDDLLTLEGLRIIYERNQAHMRRRNEHPAGNETPEGGSARATISSVPKPD
jgi:type III pantothenate kinase